MGVRDLTVADANNIALGRMDFVEISNGTILAADVVPGTIFNALVVDTDATFSADTVDGDNLSSQARLAGRVILGRFTGVTESAGGVVLAYFGTD